MSDPRYTDPRLSDPVLRRDEGLGGTWGWIAGVAVLLLIGFLIIAGGHGIGISASNGPSPAVTGSTSHPATPPATTGSGAMSPRPLMPLPNKSGTQ